MKEDKIQFQDLDEVLRAAQLRRSGDLSLWLGRLLQMRRESRAEKGIVVSSATTGKEIYG